MNVTMVQMPPDEARAQLREYRRSLHRRADAEYEAVAKGLEELANGTPIINLTDAIAQGGFFESGLPRLAIARADRHTVTAAWGQPRWNYPWRPRTTLTFDARARRGRPDGWNLEVIVPLGSAAPDRRGDSGTTLVPMIPANVRNSVRFRADRVFILWEVEKWDRVPATDPLLLRHLHGDAYAVLAAWDLTPLERMVMAGRRNLA